MILEDPDYRLVDHTSDLGIEVFAKDLKGLFVAAARSMTLLMLTYKAPKQTTSLKLRVTAGDLPDLMVRWLGEVLYRFQGEHRVLINADIHSLSPQHLEATLRTIAFDPGQHEIEYDIKAVTYHQIQVSRRGECWVARIIFDL